MPKVPVDPRTVLAREMKEEGLGGLREAVELLAHQLGYETRHIRDSRRQNVSDLPDLLLIKPPHKYWAELKRYGKNPTPGQATMIDALRLCGDTVFIWRPQDLFSGEIHLILAGLATSDVV